MERRENDTAVSGPARTWPFDESDSTNQIILRRAKRLVRRSKRSVVEQDDLEQELKLQLLASTSSFDPNRGNWEAYATVVVMHAGSTAIRNQHALKRDDRTTASLVIKEAQSMEPRDKRLEHDRISDEEHVNLRADIESLTKDLPHQWQVMLSLRSAHSMNQVAIEMGVARSTLNGWMKKIRRRFESAGMQKYFEKTSASL